MQHQAFRKLLLLLVQMAVQVVIQQAVFHPELRVLHRAVYRVAQAEQV
jgi:hypothetical protein